eukprot:4295683-Lingulodinium_polyedra.AAC.1
MDRLGSLDCPRGPDSVCTCALHAYGSDLQLGTDTGGALSLSVAEYAEHLAEQSAMPPHRQSCSCDSYRNAVSDDQRAM